MGSWRRRSLGFYDRDARLLVARDDAGLALVPGLDQTMSLFIDVHTLDGPIGIADVEKAHAADLQTQEKYGVK